MKDYIKEIEGRYYERLMYYPQDCDSSWVIDIKNLLALVKAYENEMRRLVNSDGVASIDQEQAFVSKRIEEIKKQIFEKEVGK